MRGGDCTGVRGYQSIPTNSYGVLIRSDDVIFIMLVLNTFRHFIFHISFRRKYGSKYDIEKVQCISKVSKNKEPEQTI